MEIKLIQDVIPGEYIRYLGRWIQVEMIEFGILACWVHHARGTVMLDKNTRVAVVQPLPEVEVVWPTRGELPG